MRGIVLLTLGNTLVKLAELTASSELLYNAIVIQLTLIDKQSVHD
jgi:hypothetical protein